MSSSSHFAAGRRISTRANGLKYNCSRLPEDIIEEIISWLPPASLGRWARVNTHFRRRVLGSDGLWERVLQLVPGLPVRPSEIKRPIDYARLVFGTWCFTCKRARAGVAAYELHMRLCDWCRRGLDRVQPMHSDLIPSLWYHGKRLVTTAAYTALATRLLTDDGASLMKFRAAQEKRTSEVMEHAKRLYSWEREQAALRRSEQDRLRAVKLDAAVDLLKAAGYGDFIPCFQFRLKEQPEFKKFLATTNMSDKVWKNNSVALIVALKRVHREDTERAHKAALLAQAERMETAKRTLRRVAAPYSVRMPRMPDLNDETDMAFFPGLSALLSRSTSTSREIELELPKLLPQFLRWENDILARPFLAEIARVLDNDSTWEFVAESSLTLAISVFRNSMNLFGVAPLGRPHYPFILEETRGVWTFDDVLATSICLLLQRCNLSPMYTTWSQMEEMDYRFTCRTCLELDCRSRGGPVVRNWWRMVDHLRFNHRDIRGDVWRVSPEVEAAVRVIDPARSSAMWRCSLCFIDKGFDATTYFHDLQVLRTHMVVHHYVAYNEIPNSGDRYSSRQLAPPSSVVRRVEHGDVFIAGEGYFMDVPADYQSATVLHALPSCHEYRTTLSLSAAFGSHRQGTLRLFSS